MGDTATPTLATPDIGGMAPATDFFGGAPSVPTIDVPGAPSMPSIPSAPAVSGVDPNLGGAAGITADVLSSRGTYPSGPDATGFTANPQAPYDPSQVAGAVAPGGAGAPGGGGGFLDAAGRAVGSVAGDLTKAAPLAVDALKIGSGGLGAYAALNASQQASKQAGILEKAQKLQQQSAAPAVDFARTELTQAQTGQIPAAQQQVIDNWKQQAKAQLRQKLAHLGITDSTTMAEYEAYIDQQAAELQNQALQAEAGLGLQGIGAATGALGGGAATTAQSQEATLQSAIAQANQNIARLAGAGA